MSRLVTLRAALLAALVLAGCQAGATAPPASTVGVTSAAGATASTSTGAPSGTTGTRPAATATPAPCIAPTATAGGEVVASTAAVPTASLPKAMFVPPGGGAAVELPIEVARYCEFGIGLSGRKSLTERGMLFYFPDPADTPFWMKDTHIDLDIAFVDAAMNVIGVETMKADTLDHHKPGKPYAASIEAPAGWYAAHGVKVGWTVLFGFDLRAASGR